jgi:hypothetical protein
MVDVQRLLTDIGSMMLRLSMRLQNELPKGLISKFDLTIGGNTSGGLNSGPSEGNDEALEKAMEILCATLDFLGTGAVGSWMEDNFQEDEDRCRITKDLIELSEHLEGYVLEYGPYDNQRKFEGLDKDKLQKYLVNDGWISAAIGKIDRDPVKKNHWNMSNDQYLVPISFDKNIAPADVPSFSAAGPVILIGKVSRNSEGHITSIEKVQGCYTIPQMRFLSVITKDGDRVLLNPLVAIVGYDAETDTWSLSNDDLGIKVNKPSWDECVISFHEYAYFLFENYVDNDKELAGEELEIRQFLESLLPV